MRKFCQLNGSHSLQLTFSTPADCEPLQGLIITCDLSLCSRQADEPMEHLFAGDISLTSPSLLSQGVAQIREAHPQAKIVWRSLAPGVEHERFQAWELCHENLRALEEPKKPESLALKTVYSSGMTLQISIENCEPLKFLTTPQADCLSLDDGVGLEPQLSAQLSRVLAYIPGRPVPSCETLQGWLRRLGSLPDDWQVKASQYHSYTDNSGRCIRSEPFRGEIAGVLVVQDGEALRAVCEEPARPELAHFCGNADGITKLDYRSADGNMRELRVPLYDQLVATPEDLEASQKADQEAPARRRARGSWIQKAIYKIDDTVPVLGLLSRRWSDVVRKVEVDSILRENAADSWARCLSCSRILMLPVVEKGPAKLVIFDYGVAVETVEADLGAGSLCLVDSECINLVDGAIVRDEAYEALLGELRAQLGELRQLMSHSGLNS